MSFSKLGLTPSLCTPLAPMGYKEPTPVQAESIPVVLSGTVPRRARARLQRSVCR